MNAKEERARNLEIHKMTRTHSELSKHNAALESECSQLRLAIKQTSEKYAAAHDAMSKRHAAAMESEHEKMNALQRQFDKERESWTERANKDSVAERMRHFDALNDIKRQFDAMYAEKMNANKAAHDAALQQLAEEREQTKRDAQEQLARLNEDRQQVKRELDEAQRQIKLQLDELQAQIKRDKQEHMIRMVFELDSEREKMKCLLETEREALADQFRKDDIEKRQASDNELTELKRQMESNLRGADAAMHQLNEDREKLRQHEADLVLQDRERHEHLKKKEEEQDERLRNKEEHMKRKEEEREEQLRDQLEQLKKKDEEREEQLRDQLEQLKKKEEEREEQMRHQMNQLKKKEEDQNEQFGHHMKLINDERFQMQQQLDEEREQIKRNEREQHVQFLMHMKSEREKMKCQIEQEREQMAEQAHRNDEAQRASNADALAEARRTMEDNFNARVNENRAAHDAAMQKLHEEREQLKLHFNELCERNKRNELEHAKIKELQIGLKQEKERVLEQAQKDAEVQRQSNAEALAEAKRMLDNRFNAAMSEHRAKHDDAMQRLNEERDQLKQTDLIRENEHKLLSEHMKHEAAAQYKSNTDAMFEAKRELETRFNATMQKLNEEREQRKHRLGEEQERNKRDELEREKIHAMQCRLDQERVNLFEQARKDNEVQCKSNTDALAEAKRQQEARFNVLITEQRGAFDAAMQKLSDERDQLKQREHMMNDMIHKKLQELRHELEQERHVLAEQARKDDETQRKSNADALAEAKRKQEAQFNATMNERRIAFDATMRQLNEEREQLQCKLDNENNEIIQQHEMAFEAKMRQMTDEWMQTKQQLNDERFKLQTLKRQLENEHEISMEKVRNEQLAQQQSNAEALRATTQMLNEKCAKKMNEHKTAFDTTMQQLNAEREQVQQQMEEDQARIRQRLEEEREQTNCAALEMEKMRMLQWELAKERDQMISERTLLANERVQLGEERTLLAEERNEIKQEHQQTTGLIASLMNEVEQLKTQSREEREKHVRANNELKHRLDVEKPIAESLHDAVASNYAHLQLILGIDFKDKRVAIYSHYSESDEVESYNMLTIECIQHYFDYIIILTNCPNKWNMHAPNYNKCHLLHYNMKSDFRNYGVFIMQAETKLVNASRMCLINDSFLVVDANAFGVCMKRLFENDTMSHDFIGMTSSYENAYHLQSYFMCFGGATLPDVMSYFKTRGLPMNHAAAISKYELGISLHLIDKGFTSHALVTNNEMRIPLNTTCCKWSNVLEETGIIKRQHFLKKYAYAAMTDSDIAEVAENYAYNKHLVHFLKYNNVQVVKPNEKS